MQRNDCIFCKIVQGDIPSVSIYENTDFKVILDVAPANRGHVLVIPKDHYQDIYDIDAITAGKMFELVAVVARAMKEVLHCEGMNILQNNGSVAGQTVDHIHIHLIPRFEGDHVTIGWEELTVKEKDQKKLRDQIRQAL